MTTALSSNHRRCDAKCHNAEGSECNCICGGRNHGVGFTQAVANNREFLEAEGIDIKPFTQPMEEILHGTYKRVVAKTDPDDGLPLDTEDGPIPSPRIEDGGKSLQMSYKFENEQPGEVWFE
jgi:hypothetical protein